MPAVQHPLHCLEHQSTDKSPRDFRDDFATVVARRQETSSIACTQCTAPGGHNAVRVGSDVTVKGGTEGCEPQLRVEQELGGELAALGELPLVRRGNGTKSNGHIHAFTSGVPRAKVWWFLQQITWSLLGAKSEDWTVVVTTFTASRVGDMRDVAHEGVMPPLGAGDGTGGLTIKDMRSLVIQSGARPPGGFHRLAAASGRRDPTSEGDRRAVSTSTGRRVSSTTRL